MNKAITINDKKISYKLRKSKKAGRLRLCVRRDLSVTVTLPCDLRESEAEKLVKERCDWILGKMEYYKICPSSIPEPEKIDYAAKKETARAIAEKKLAHFNRFYGFSWNKICIRNPIGRWASCSANRNLNFSYRIVYLPEELQDYIIVHELCHLKEFNHSPAFWNLMAKTVPDYESKRRKIVTM